MTATNDDSPQLTERAADDLLLLLARVESYDVALPGPDEVAGVISAYTDQAMSEVARYVRRHGKLAARHAQFGFEAAANPLGEAVMGHLLLSIRLLVWTAHRTGLTHAQVVAEVLAQTDVEKEN